MLEYDGTEFVGHAKNVEVDVSVELKYELTVEDGEAIKR